MFVIVDPNNTSYTMYSHVYNISAYQISHPSSNWPLVIVIETKTEGNFRTTDKFEVSDSKLPA
jgi:hypothetical protein